MDFDPEAAGWGSYESLDTGLLPPLVIAYATGAAQTSDEAHRAVRARFRAGDEKVRDAMSSIAALADQARDALLGGDHEEPGRLMSANLELRRGIFELEPGHLRMAQVAAEIGLPANYAGSGGAIVALTAEAGQGEELDTRLRSERCEVLTPRIAAGLADP